MNQERQDSLIRQLQGGLGGNRIVRGIITTTAGTPTIDEGTGFTAARNGVGDVTITFDPAFSDIPSVTFSGSSAGGSIRIVQHGGLATASTARCVIVNSLMAVVESQFHFIAIGPA